MALMRVLMVDDDEEISHVMRAGIHGEMFHVEIAPGVDEALAHLASHHFDIVVTDYQMEPRDGMELLQIIKEQYPHTDVIMMTGYGTIDTIFKALKLGAYDFLIKPPELKLLKAALMRCREKRVYQAQFLIFQRAIQNIVNALKATGDRISGLRTDLRQMELDAEHETCREFAEKILAEMDHQLAGFKLELPKHRKPL